MAKDGKKNLGGRPTSYKQEYCEDVVNHMSRGLSFESFAGKIRVNVDTLYEWAKVHSEFSEAKKLGFACCRLFWEELSINGIWNDPDGRNINTGMFVFNMKNRFKWTDRVEVSGTEDGEEKPLVLSYNIPKK